MVDGFKEYQPDRLLIEKKASGMDVRTSVVVVGDFWSATERDIGSHFFLHERDFSEVVRQVVLNGLCHAVCFLTQPLDSACGAGRAVGCVLRQR